MKKYLDKDTLAYFAQKLTTKQKEIFATKNEVGAPLVAQHLADMTDTSKIYVYIGGETGMTYGNWYYWNDNHEEWRSGGIYNSAAVATDETLTEPGMPADAKAVGDALAEKADTDGDYPDMSVGEAAHANISDLAAGIETDREIEDAEESCPPIVFGTVGGNAEVQSGLMKFPELRGHTIKWNQLVQKTTTSSGTENGVTYTVDEETITVSTVETGATGYTFRDFNPAFNMIAGHKYLIYGIPSGLTNSTCYIYLLGSGVVSNQLAENTIVTCTTSTSTAKFRISVNSGVILSAPKVFRLQMFDLTDIYGAGNEPSTVAEFVRDFPLPYYEYNAGTLLSSKSSSVDFVKRNQCPALDTFFNVLPNTEYEVSGITAGGYLQEFDGNKTLINTSSEITTTTDITLTAQTVYAKIQATTYTNVLCYNKWGTPNLPYVSFSDQHITLPNIELRSAGSAYDVAYQKGGGKRRIGVVDLGTLNYLYVVDGDYPYMLAALSGVKPSATNYTVANASSTIGDCVPAASIRIDGVFGFAVENQAYIRIRLTNMSTDPVTFKAAMSGVMLYYELATETDITLEENPGWTEYAEIDNFGTVKFNQDPAQTIPVPQAYFVRYTVNLVEFLDSLFVEAGGDAGGIALKSDIVIPDAPTTDGTYTLKVTVASGVPTYFWVLDE